MAVMLMENRKLELLNDPELPTVLHDATLKNCWFFACHFGMTAKHPSERRRIKNVTIASCKATNNSSLGPVLVEDVDVDGLETGGLCIAWGSAYRHVRIRGRCGRLMLWGLPETSTPPEVIRLFEQENQHLYQATDWALDISEGEFEELEIRNVPTDLVRRDPATQVVVRRTTVESTQDVWRKLDLSGTPWGTSLDNMLRWGLEDQVLIAPKRRKDFPQWLAGLRLLQKEGVAERD